MTVGFEREIKLAYASAAAAREAVAALGATPLRARRLQSDTLFDTATGMLGMRRAVLRVRREGSHCAITFKNPAEHPTMKLREEIETTAGDGDAIVAILAQLGFAPWFSYEKYREEFAVAEVVIAIDDTPVGAFLEIEGSEAGIAATAAALGKGPADYIVDSYRTLFLRYCAERGIAATHMLFAALHTPAS